MRSPEPDEYEEVVGDEDGGEEVLGVETGDDDEKVENGIANG